MGSQYLAEFVRIGDAKPVGKQRLFDLKHGLQFLKGCPRKSVFREPVSLTIRGGDREFNMPMGKAALGTGAVDPQFYIGDLVRGVVFGFVVCGLINENRAVIAQNGSAVKGKGK